MPLHSINAARLIGRIRELGEIGRDPQGQLTRLAGSDNDRAGRDRLVAWIRAAGLDVVIDRIGNIFGVWRDASSADAEPLMLGSHIDTVINAGIYDGCYGVIAALEVIETLKERGVTPARPIVVAAFTNEEGVRFAPDMLGSLVYAGGLSLETALAIIGTDGTVLGEELARIGYAGTLEPGFSSLMPMSNSISSRDRCWSVKGRRSVRSKTCRASPGNASPSMASPTMPARRRWRCAATPGLPPPALACSCASTSPARTRRAWPQSAPCVSSPMPST